MLRCLVIRGWPGLVLAAVGGVISIACVAWLLTLGFVWIVDQAIKPDASADATPPAVASATAQTTAPCAQADKGDVPAGGAQAARAVSPAAIPPASAAGGTSSASASTDAAPKRPPAATARRKTGSSVLSRMLAPGRFAYHEMVRETAKRHAVEMKLVMAIIASESGGDPNAVSPAGAVGLMQLMPETAARLGVDPYDPEQNVDGAVRYLKSQLKMFKSVDLSLIAYNAGPGFAIQYRKGQVELGAETRAFLTRVGDLLQ